MGVRLSQCVNWGGSKPTTWTEDDKAILYIRQARNELSRCLKQQVALAERSLVTVNELLKADRRDRAMVALRKKKLHEKQALSIEENILLLDQQAISLQQARQQVDTVASLKKANEAMKSVQQQMPLEEIERLMDESAEAAQYMEQVNGLLANSTVSISDAEVDSELAAIEHVIAKEDLARLPEAPKVPAKPQEATAAAQPDATQAQASAQPTPDAMPTAADDAAPAAAATQVKQPAVQQPTEQRPEQAARLPDVPTHDPLAAEPEEDRQELEEPLLA